MGGGSDRDAFGCASRSLDKLGMTLIEDFSVRKTAFCFHF